VNSAGYDLVIEIHKQLYNKILDEIYKTNSIIASNKKGLYSYELKLDKAPIVDHFKENRIAFTIDLNTKIHLLRIININMDSVAHLLVSIQSDKTSKKLVAKLLESKLTKEPRKNENIVMRQFSRLYYNLLNLLIDSRLAHHYEKLALSPSLYSFTLPELEKENLSPIQIDIADITAVNGEVTAILINLLGRTKSSTNLLTDYTVGQDISFSLSADAIQRIKKYWWGNPDKSISDEFTGKLEIKPDISLELLTRLGLALDDLLERHKLPINHEVREWWIDYMIKVTLGEPELILKEGNELEIPGLKIRLDIDAKLQLSTSAPNDNGKSQTLTATTFTERDLELIVREASASIHLDSNYRVVAKLEKLDIVLDLNWSISTEIIDLFIDRVEEHIKQLISDIIISPAIISEKIPGTDLQFKFDLNRIETSIEEITIGGSLESSGK
jgi:hypothetical protein